MPRIVVIGAGVVGLTTAYLLSEKGFDVTILAKHLPGDLSIEYTSPWAGANWHSFAGPKDYESQDFDKAGYRKFLHLADHVPESGVIRRTSINYYTKEQLGKKTKEQYTPWYRNFVENYKEIPQSELPEGVAFGFSFAGVVISTNIYLNYLLNKCVQNGAVLRRKVVHHIQDAFGLHSTGERADVVVNCTGLLSRSLGGVEDKKVFPIRGQSLVVENTADVQFAYNYRDPEHPYEMLYVMPRREGGALIGGCFLINNDSAEVDYAQAERFKQVATKWFPDLVDPAKGNPPELNVVRYQVGLRPQRKGGYRIEKEGNIVHNYGHGGAGYQSSYGTAGKAIRLVEDVLNKPKL